jgi:tetratricopeptide (TPR) repeat protein
MMSCREIAQEIERSLDFLTTSLRDVPERHHSLRAVFEHSWQLLSEEEKAVFRKLSVFRGGFRHRAAKRVADASLPLLSALVDKSLLRRTRTGRYQIHELLRQYAAEKLSEVPGEGEQARDRHSEYYLTYLQQRTEDIKGRRQKDALDEIAADIDNIRVAWYRAIVQRNITALGRSADGLLLFSDYRGWFVEAAAAFRQAVGQLTEAQESEIVLAQLLAGEGLISVRLGFMVQGQELLQQSVSLLRRAEGNLQRELAFSLFWLAHAYLFQGQYVEANRDFQESLNIYTEAGDRWGIGVALVMLGQVMAFQGTYTAANQFIRQSLEIFKQLGERRWMTYSIDFLGRTARVLGEYGQAGKFLEESLQMRRDLDTPFGIGYSMRELGYLALALGNYQQAKEWMQASLTTFREIGARTHLIFPLDGLGSIARLRGEYQLAKQLHQESLAIAEETGEGRGIATGYGSLGWLAYDMEDYPKAEQLLLKSLTAFEQIGHQVGIASTHCCLGYVACALGRDRYQEAWQQFHRALEIATEIEARPVALNVLVGRATLLTSSESRDTERKQAIELLALTLHHPASDQETKDRARRLFDKLAYNLPSGWMAEVQDRSKANKMLDTVVMEILEHKGLDWQNSG